MNDAQLESVEYLAGQMIGAVGPGAVDDVIVSIGQRDFVGALASAAGLVSGSGAAFKGAEKLAAFAAKSERANRVARALLQKLPLPKTTQDALLLKLAGSSLRLPLELDGGPEVYQVYVGRSPGRAIVYCGITNNVALRQTQHGGRFAITPIVGASGLSRGEARAIEEACIQTFSGDLENKIHSISPNKTYYDDAVDWGEDWLTRNGFAA